MLTLLKLKDLESAEKDGEILDLQSQLTLLKLPTKMSNKAITANLMQEEAKSRDAATQVDAFKNPISQKCHEKDEIPYELYMTYIHSKTLKENSPRTKL